MRNRMLVSNFVLAVVVIGCVGADPEITSDAETNEGTKLVSSGKGVTETKEKMDYNELTDFEKHVILGKGTEGRYVGEYTDLESEGTYICRQCNAQLYKSTHKFHSGCGWPAFDDEIEGAVTRHPDADGRRTEIVCTNCGGHLGHVFIGERLTEKNVRHCVNSISMKFVAAGEDVPAVIK